MRRNILFGLLLVGALSIGCSRESAREGQEKRQQQQELQRQRQRQQLGFDSELWKAGAEHGSEEREAMLKDLMSIDSLRYSSEDVLVDVLGKPDKRVEGYLYYRIKETQLITWTVHAKTLVIVLGGDTARHKMLIHE